MVTWGLPLNSHEGVCGFNSHRSYTPRVMGVWVHWVCDYVLTLSKLFTSLCPFCQQAV